MQDDIQQQFQQALDQLIERLQEDRNILAAILFGSLSYDTVWEKSDIDLMLITTEARSTAEEKLSERFIALIERDVNIHAHIKTRSNFKRMIEGSLRSSFMHSSFVKSRLLFSRDKTLNQLYDGVLRLGQRDRQTQLFCAAAQVMPLLAKAEKFCRIKGDPHYAFLWITQTYSSLARIETYLHDEIADREVLQRALELNPAFFESIYTDLIDARKTPERIEAALQAIDAYLGERIPELFQPLLDHLESVGEIRSVTEIETWCEQQMNAEGAVSVCEWLADRGVVVKTSAPLRLTRRSLVEVDELAFFYDPTNPG